jgi:GTP-binding protein EngB required for normal cell division
MKLEIDFDKLSEKRRNAVLNALFDGANELGEKYEKVLDKMVIQRNENRDLSTIEAQEKMDKIYSDNEALINEHNEVLRLMIEVTEPKNRRT